MECRYWGGHQPGKPDAGHRSLREPKTNDTGDRGCAWVPDTPGGLAAWVGENGKSPKVPARCRYCQNWVDISGQETAALEPPLEFRVEDDPFCIQQRIAVVGLSEIQLVADLNVFVPVPDQVGV